MNSCPVCAAPLRQFDRIKDLDGQVVDILQCLGCDALVNANAYELRASTELKDIHHTDFYLAPDVSAEQVSAEMAATDPLFANVEKHIDLKPDTVFLDFGAGRGYVAMQASKRYAKAIACEWDTRAIESILPKIPELPNLDVVNDIEKIRHPVDFLFMWHTLEHIPDPTNFWRQHIDRLSERCVIHLQVPLYRPQHVVKSHYVFYTEHSLCEWTLRLCAKPIAFLYDVENGFIEMIAQREPVTFSRC